MTDNQHNDPLESFFRKKAGEYDIQYKEEDWEKLEGRLDAVDKQYAVRKRRRLAAAVILVLFSILGYITFEQQQEIDQLTKRLGNTENTVNPNPLLGLPDQQLNTNEPLAAESDSPDDTPSTDAPSPSLADESLRSEKESTRQKNSERTLASQKISTEDSQSDFLSETNLVVTSAKSSPGFDGRSPAISAIKPPKFNANSLISEDPGTNSSKPRLTHGPTSRRTFSRFTIGILAGPDLSTVGGVSNFYDAGNKFGISLEYNITQNLALSVGAIRSNVRYTASGNDYQPPQGYWSYGTVPNETIGECILIDIPVSLKYSFWNFDHSRLYATAGLSSYIMLDEDYRFQYDYNRPGLKQRWHERTGTRHWISNATLSVGYELDVLRNVSVRAEPFLRLPLQEVGWGNVKLYSMGTFISLNYHIR